MACRSARSRPSSSAFPVTVPPDDTNVLFSHVVEGLDFPMPTGRRYRLLRRLYRVRSGRRAGNGPPEAGAETGQAAAPPGEPGRPELGRALSPIRTDLTAAQRDDRALERPHVGDHGAGAGAGELRAEIGLVWLPPMKPIGIMPAAWAAATPAGDPPPRCSRRARHASWRRHEGTGPARACRAERRSPKTDKDRRTAAARCFPG